MAQRRRISAMMSSCAVLNCSESMGSTSCGVRARVATMCQRVNAAQGQSNRGVPDPRRASRPLGIPERCDRIGRPCAHLRRRKKDAHSPTIVRQQWARGTSEQEEGEGGSCGRSYGGGMSGFLQSANPTRWRAKRWECHVLHYGNAGNRSAAPGIAANAPRALLAASLP
jgi:hypothetical protein